MVKTFVNALFVYNNQVQNHPYIFKNKTWVAKFRTHILCRAFFG